MVRFGSLTLSHFRSFADEQTISLSRPPGLYHLHGVNNVDPQISPNGVGKSTLIDALCFALYGKTVTGARGPDLRNWQTRGQARVVVEGVAGKDVFTITRTIGPNALLLAKGKSEASECAQEDLDRLTGLTHELFTLCVAHGQAAATFLDYGATQQLETLSTMLGLDRYSEAGEQASRRAGKYGKRIADLERDLSYGRGERKSLSREIEELEIEDCDWHRDRLVRLKALRVARDQHAVNANDLQARLAAHDDKVLAATASKRAELAEARDALAEIKAVLAGHVEEARALGDELTRLDLAVNTTRVCPTCKRAYDTDQAVKAHLCAELAQVEARSSELGPAVDELKALAQDAATLVSTREREVSDVYAPWQDETNRLRSAWADEQAAFNSTAREFRDVIKSVSPHGAKLAAREKLLADVTAKLSGLEGEITDLTAKRELYAYWIRGFRDLRLHVTEQALLHLTLNVNSALVALGLLDWKIAVQAESTAKSGALKRGMTVLAGKDDDLRPVALYSAGERQRLRLAVALGFASLVQSSSGVNVNVEFYDEPSSWLSAAGVGDLLRLLDERARQTGRAIYVADHHSLNYPFAGSVQLLKNKEGTRAA